MTENTGSIADAGAKGMEMVGNDPIVGPLADAAVKSIMTLITVIHKYPEKNKIVYIAAQGILNAAHNLERKAGLRTELELIYGPEIWNQ